MRTHSTPHMSSLLVAVALLAALALSAGCQPEDPPFVWGGGGGGSSNDDDDDAVGSPDETWAVARIEVTRSDIEGTTGAIIRAVGSWFPNQSVQLRPDPPDDLDSCHTGSSPSGQFVIPDSTLDVGNMILVMADGEHTLDFDDGYFQDVLPYNSWNPNDEFDIVVTGGPGLDATEFSGAIGTPPSVAISGVEESGGEVTVEWLGGQDINQVTILVTASADDSMSWVSCKVQDDGQFTVNSAALSSLPTGTALLDIRREVRSSIDVDGQPGVVIGTSSASVGGSIAAAGDDDDSAAQP